jgi:hypothetical protein
MTEDTDTVTMNMTMNSMRIMVDHDDGYENIMYAFIISMLCDLRTCSG